MDDLMLPVAWLDEEKRIIYWHNTHEVDDYHGFKRTLPLYTEDQLREYAKKAMEAEREACAKVCDNAPKLGLEYWSDVAEAIRARRIRQNI